MGDFFKSIKFKILIGVFVVLLGITTFLGVNNRQALNVQTVFNIVAVPFQKFTSAISYHISDIFDKKNVEEITLENEELKAEILKLNNQLVDYYNTKAENSFYEKALHITQEEVELKQVVARVIAKDPLDKFHSFTIDKGTSSGIEVDDVVHTAEGLVGKVLETGFNYLKVITIFDPKVNVGCTVSRNQELGTLEGETLLTLENKVKLTYLPMQSVSEKGDIVVTTGYGEIFPKGLIVGKIDEVLIESSGKGKYATIIPSADIANTNLVFVITDFM